MKDVKASLKPGTTKEKEMKSSINNVNNETIIETIKILLEPRDEMSTAVLRGIVDAIYLLVKENE